MPKWTHQSDSNLINCSSVDDSESDRDGESINECIPTPEDDNDESICEVDLELRKKAKNDLRMQ